MMRPMPPASAPFTDIRAAGWVSRLPAAGGRMRCWPGWTGRSACGCCSCRGCGASCSPARRCGEAARLLALFAVGSLVMRAAGCVVNDMWDRDLDRQVARTARAAARPAARCACGRRRRSWSRCSAAGCWCCCSSTGLAQALGVASLLLVALYPLAKRVTWWPQVVLGFTFGCGAPMGWTRPPAPWAPRPGARSTPPPSLWDPRLRHGLRPPGPGGRRAGGRALHRPAVRGARPAVPGACYAGAVALLALAGVAGRAVRLVLRPRCCRPAALLACQVRRLDPHDPAGCLRLFQLNREAGLPRPALWPAAGEPCAAHARTRGARRSCRDHTAPARTALVPEIELLLATEITPIWHATEAWLAERDVEPPFWAFAWPGGQALARLRAGPPGARAGRRVLDFAAGGGIAAIACRPRRRRARGGGGDRPPGRRRHRAQRRAQRPGRAPPAGDVVGQPCRWDLILCGDVCYEAPMTGTSCPGCAAWPRAPPCWSPTPAAPTCRATGWSRSPATTCRPRWSSRTERCGGRGYFGCCRREARQRFFFEKKKQKNF